MLIKMSTRRSSRKAAAASERVENAARKCRVKKSIEKAQQEEAFKEFVALIGANGGKEAIPQMLILLPWLAQL